MQSVFILLIIVVFVVTTVVRAFFTARFLVAFFVTSLVAIRTTLLAVAGTPNRVNHQVQNLDGVVGVVAGDDQLTTSRTFFIGFITDDDA